MKRIFISYTHKDSVAFNSVLSALSNPENQLYFCNRSLSAPVLNEYNHVNRRSPADPASKPVRKEISSLLDKSDKLLLLVGENTHSSLWVEWEIKAFVSKNSNKDIYIMRVNGNTTSSLPKKINEIKSLPIYNWDLSLLGRWAR